MTKGKVGLPMAATRWLLRNATPGRRRKARYSAHSKYAPPGGRPKAQSKKGGPSGAGGPSPGVDRIARKLQKRSSEPGNQGIGPATDSVSPCGTWLAARLPTGIQRSGVMRVAAGLANSWTLTSPAPRPRLRSRT